MLFGFYGRTDLVLRLFIPGCGQQFDSSSSYSHWMQVEDELWLYAEVACPNESHEIHLFRVQPR
ncbi:MAG: hypothetical protein JXA82_19395 [Sedimentisphaerales bacterium]|nr:hypothetical protein [Sedimentisphaerales bacterium]